MEIEIEENNEKDRWKTEEETYASEDSGWFAIAEEEEEGGGWVLWMLREEEKEERLIDLREYMWGLGVVKIFIGGVSFLSCYQRNL